MGRILLDNRSGYHTGDLARFFRAGFQAYGVKKPVSIVVTAHPTLTRGCAVVGGSRLVFALAPPSRFRMRRAARVLEHECAHLRGMEHEDMPENLYWSEGAVPRWAEGLQIRFVERAVPRDAKTHFGKRVVHKATVFRLPVSKHTAHRTPHAQAGCHNSPWPMRRKA